LIQPIVEGWGEVSATSERLNPDLGMRGGESFKVFRISGEDVSTAGHDRLGYDERVDDGCRACPAEKLAGRTAMPFVEIRNDVHRLENPMNRRVARTPAQGLRDDHHRYLDGGLPLRARGRRTRGPADPHAIARSRLRSRGSGAPAQRFFFRGIRPFSADLLDDSAVDGARFRLEFFQQPCQPVALELVPQRLVDVA